MLLLLIIIIIITNSEFFIGKYNCAYKLRIYYVIQTNDLITTMNIDIRLILVVIVYDRFFDVESQPPTEKHFLIILCVLMKEKIPWKAHVVTKTHSGERKVHLIAAKTHNVRRESSRIKLQPSVKMCDEALKAKNILLSFSSAIPSYFFKLHNLVFRLIQGSEKLMVYLKRNFYFWGKDER